MKSLHHGLIALLIGWLLLACATPQPLPSPSPSIAPTSTVPSLVHRWIAPTVIAQTFDVPGPEGGHRGYQRVLYADGRLIATRYNIMTGAEPVLEARLSHDEVCTFLTDMETIGFFDTGPQASLEALMPTDEPTTYLIVNGWRSQEIVQYGLSSVEYEVQEGIIERADVFDSLLDSYERIMALGDRKLKPYVPEQLVAAFSDDIATQTATDWPLMVPIASLLTDAHTNRDTGEQVVLFEGEEVATLYALAGGEKSVRLRDGDAYYYVAVDPVYPHEVVDVRTGGSWPWEPKTFAPSETEWECVVQP